MEKTESVKEMTAQEVRDLAENIVSKTSENKSDYDSVDEVTSILNNLFEKVGIEVKSINTRECKCTNCACGKK